MVGDFDEDEMLWCAACQSWRHSVPCGRDECPYAPPKNRHAVILGRKGGKVGGLSTSAAKQAAARANGAKGGRPRKP